MRIYKVIAEIDWVVNFKKEFNINNVQFYSEESKMYAKVEFQETDFRNAQFKSFNLFQSACGALSHLERYIIKFRIVRVHEIDSMGEKQIPIQNITASRHIEKEIDTEVLNKAKEIQNLASKYPVLSQYLDFMLYSDYYTWITLYKVYELINRDVGNVKNIGWITKKQRDRFTNTANNPAASGFGSRHAVSSTEPPSEPMDIDEAADFIKGLVDKWLNYYQQKED
ncbi:hypothetical protein [Lysinibacillus fusiformis]|uniref:hypothetical protein n=1 Tax=Lysinibacillus fusiformis TaxID=28031 RepID=UPI00382A5BB4